MPGWASPGEQRETAGRDSGERRRAGAARGAGRRRARGQAQAPHMRVYRAQGAGTRAAGGITRLRVQDTRAPWRTQRGSSPGGAEFLPLGVCTVGTLPPTVKAALG